MTPVTLSWNAGFKVFWNLAIFAMTTLPPNMDHVAFKTSVCHAPCIVGFSDPILKLHSQTPFSDLHSQTPFLNSILKLHSQTPFSNSISDLHSQTPFSDLHSQTPFSESILRPHSQTPFSDLIPRLHSQTSFPDSILMRKRIWWHKASIFGLAHDTESDQWNCSMVLQ